MQRKVIDVDCVIEVHDARIPFSGRNTTFKVGFKQYLKVKYLISLSYPKNVKNNKKKKILMKSFS